MNRLFLLPILCIFMFGCNKNSNNQYNPDTYFHTMDLTFSSAQNVIADTSLLSKYLLEENLSVSRLYDMTINPETKNLFLIDGDNNIIKLDSSGTPLFTIRSHGKGPGEFMGSHSIKVRNKYLYIYDKTLNKISKYSLNGDFIKDIFPKNARIHAFEVSPDGKIIIPNLYAAHKGTLFLLFNENGKKVGNFGDNKIIQKDLKATNMLPLIALSLSKTGKLVLCFDTPGIFYAFDWKSKSLDYKFGIQGGPEWEQSFNYEKNKDGFPQRVRDICFTSDGRMLVGWGGHFKDKISIGMQYEADGRFLGRIFANEQLKYVPSHMVLENDSTLWVYNSTTYVLFKTHLRPAHKDKEREFTEQNSTP